MSMQNFQRDSHEKLLKFAQSIGMGGLGYLEVLEDKSYKGPIDKFIPDDMKQEIADIAGLDSREIQSSLLLTEKHRQLFMQDRFVQSLETDLTLSRRTATDFAI